MNKKVKPLFIISLPRSGSTLLQRILFAHSKISSIAEPWILFPLIYSYKRKGILTDYGHYAEHDGVTDLIKNLPNKEKDYYKFINEFVTNIYSSLSGQNSIYFCDKTPRYYMVVSDIIKIFPDAKFIFLFRNPVQIYASILSIWGSNRFNQLCRATFYHDLYEGLKILSQAYKLIKNKSYAVQYEKFVKNPEIYLQEIVDYLDLEYEKEMLLNFHKMDLKGRNVDPTGTKLYKKVDNSTLEKWKKTFNTRYRKTIIKKYIKGFDEETLLIQGYDKASILDNIKHLKNDGKHNPVIDVIDFNKCKIKNKYSRLSFE